MTKYGPTTVGSLSSVVSRTTPVAYPTDISVFTYDVSSLTLTFTSPKNSYTSSVLYTVQAIYGGNTYTKSETSPPILINNLSSGTTYTCYVTVTLDNYYTGTSNGFNATTDSIKVYNYTFTRGGILTIPSGGATINALLVGGGGNSGTGQDRCGGGGGAGGYIVLNNYSISAGTYYIAVGSCGTTPTWGQSYSSNNGGNTYAFGYTAYGGGGGGQDANGYSGGSGGGSRVGVTSGISGQGYSSGNSSERGISTSCSHAGGGGGAGGPGYLSYSYAGGSTPSHGGNAIVLNSTLLTNYTGKTMAICGGGGGGTQYWGTWSNSNFGTLPYTIAYGGNVKSNGITYYSGGNGGWSDTSTTNTYINSTNATTYGGGGGGLGAYPTQNSGLMGYGYQGVVIVTTYTKLTEYTPSSVSGLQMWLSSENYTDFGLSQVKRSYDTNLILTWYDICGNYNATATSSFLYQKYFYNGVYFSNNGYFTTTLSSTLSNETSFIVFRVGQYCTGQLFGTVSGGGRYIIATTSNNIQLGGSSTVTFSDLTFNYTNIYILVYNNNNGTQYMYLNGTKSSTTGSQTFSGTNNYTCIGAGLYGYIYEVITYNTSLSVSDKNSINKYLANKYSVTVNTITS